MSDCVRASSFSGPSRRRGAASPMSILGAAGLLGVAAAVTPAMIQGAPSDPLELQPRHEVRAALADDLAGLFGRAEAVLAVHPRRPARHLQSALWVDDLAGPGEVDADEFVVVSHSRIMRTIMTYRLDPAASAADRESAAALLRSRALDDPELAEDWRRHPAVAARVIASDLSDVRMKDADAAGERLRIELTWDAESADGPDAASRIVAIRRAERVGSSGRAMTESTSPEEHR